MITVLKEDFGVSSVDYWAEDGRDSYTVKRVQKKLCHLKSDFLMGHEFYIVELYDVYDEYCWDIPATYEFQSYGEAYDFYVRH